MKWSAEEVEEVPDGVVTVMSTVAADSAGEVAVIWVALFTVKLVAFVVPNLTAVAPVKLVPVMVTEVPPASGPEDGLTAVTVGVLEVPVVAVNMAPIPVEVADFDCVPTGAWALDELAGLKA